MVGKVREGYPADLTLKLRLGILEIIRQYLNLAEGWTILYYHFFFPWVNHLEVGNDLAGSTNLCERTRHVTW